MDNLQRITGKIFGETATATGDDPQIGQFGSALAGTYNGTTDVATIQNLAAWSNGFIDAVTPSTQFPPLPEMTGFGKVLSHQIAYILQKGLPEWDSGTTYYTGDYCKGVGNNKIYASKVDNNLNKAVTNTTYWEEILLTDSANKDLSNLSEAGEHHFDYVYLGRNRYTNCIFDINQTVKLEATNSNQFITLKAGAHIYIPNQGGWFDSVTTESDLSKLVSVSSALTLLVYYNSSNSTLDFINIANVYSGGSGTQPNNTLWYDTTNNQIIRKSSSGVVTTGCSLPLGIIKTTSTGIIASIERVFNGFGYIGDVTFCTEDVTVLYSSVRNADGTYDTFSELLQTSVSRNNYSDTTDAIWHRNDLRIDNVPKSSYLGELYAAPATDTSKFEYYFNITDGLMYSHDTVYTDWAVDNIVKLGSGNNFYTPFCAVDENKIRNAKWVVDSYTNGTSWYRVYSDGWCEQGGASAVTSTGVLTVSLLKSYKNTSYQAFKNYNCQNDTGTNDYEVSIYNKTTSSFQTFNNLADTSSIDWIAFGYIY